jgi:hypothetical protein
MLGVVIGVTAPREGSPIDRKLISSPLDHVRGDDSLADSLAHVSLLPHELSRDDVSTVRPEDSILSGKDKGT